MTTPPPQTSPPAAPLPGKRHATNSTPEGTAAPLRGKAWRDAAKAATSAMHAAQRRQATRYVKVADRTPGSQYRPGMARRST